MIWRVLKKRLFKVAPSSGYHYSKRSHRFFQLVYSMYWIGWLLGCVAIANGSRLPALVRVLGGLILVLSIPTEFPCVPYERAKRYYYMSHGVSELTDQKGDGKGAGDVPATVEIGGGVVHLTRPRSRGSRFEHR